jgi:hypothetical protein
MMPLTTVAVFVTLTGVLIAQANPPGDKERVRSSVRGGVDQARCTLPTHSRPRRLPSGAADLKNVTVEELTVDAWHIFPGQILGAPAWIRTAGYDILAKPPTVCRQTCGLGHGLVAVWSRVDKWLPASASTCLNHVPHVYRRLPRYAWVSVRTVVKTMQNGLR